MDTSETPPSEVGQGFDPNHYFATPGSRIDMNAVKPHTCMVNVKQQGGFLHCFVGNHGMNLEPGQVLVGIDADGNDITSKNRAKAVNFRIDTVTPLPPTKVARKAKA